MSRIDAASAVRQIAHHLRQPLSTIEAIAYYLEIVMPPAESKTREQLGKLQRLVQETNWIISDAVHFFQASPPHPERVDLNEVVWNAIAELPVSDPGRLEFALEDGVPPVMLDPSQAIHIVRNLVNFFQQIAKPESQIAVETRRFADAVALSVSAAAPGYPAREIEALLEPGSLAANSGAGLSMASVRRVADAHGAQVSVHSDDGSGRRTVSVSFSPAR